MGASKANRRRKHRKRKKRQKNFKRQRGKRNRAVQEFWLDFNDCITKEARLFMLKELAAKQYRVSHIPLNVRGKTMRSYWDERKNRYFRLRGQICGVCFDPATVRHHIIQLSNGGSNHGMNLIPLCDSCHAEIHPWLKNHADAS